MELPVSFKEKMRELLGESCDDLLRSYDKPPVSSIRINTSKITAGEFEKVAPFPTEPVPFVSNGYYIDDTDAWSKHPYYFAGLYYIQEASAMLPAYLLPVDEGDIVCDVCAAPGGKSTQLSPKAHLLISNDISRSRTIPLVKNLEMTGCANYLVTCSDPAKLSEIYGPCMDKVLVDAPCSGEGMFRKDPQLIASYMQKGPEGYCDIQRNILESAYKMLKPGGMLMYSTCTFSDMEDEQVVSSFTEDHKDISLIDITDLYEGFDGPYKKYEELDNIKGCVHVFPQRLRGEGHFMALMKKDGMADRGFPKRSTDRMLGYEQLPAGAKDLLGMFTQDMLCRIKNSAFILTGDGFMTMLPEDGEKFYDKSLHYARTGTCIGRVKGTSFSVHTALALASHMEDFSNVINFPAGDENVYRYLKGETIVDDSLKADKGYVLVCTDTYPLGFAKYDGVRLKNLYEKGWRLS